MPHGHRSPMVSRLPDELLVDIFALATSLEARTPIRDSVGIVPDPRLLSILLSVCRRWHLLISTYPALWTTITLRDWKHIPRLLHRSGDSPLSIFWSEIGTYEPEELVVPSLIPVLKQFMRIRHFHLTASEYTLRRYQPFIPLFPRSLETLMIAGAASGIAECKIVHARRLHTLSIDSTVVRNFKAHMFPRLRILHLDVSHRETAMAELLEFLSHSPLLEWISLRSFPPGGRLTYPRHSTFRRMIALPVLNHLDIRTHSDRDVVLSLVRHLRIPGTCELVYDTLYSSWVTEEPDEHLSSIFPFPVQDSHGIKLAILPKENYDVIDTHIAIELSDSSPIRKLDFNFSQPNNRAAATIPMSLAHLRHTGLTAVQRRVCGFATLTNLECACSVFPQTWSALFCDCTSLVTLKISLDALPGFFVSFGLTGGNGKEIGALEYYRSRPFLPALKDVYLSLNAVTDAPQSETQMTETDALAAFADALTARATASPGLFLSLFIVDCSGLPEVSRKQPYIWVKEQRSLARIRTLVSIVGVYCLPDFIWIKPGGWEPKN